MANSTMVTEFLLMGFTDVLELRIVCVLFFLQIYLATLLGNLLIVIATTIDQKLHTPMYFFLRNLSIVDMCYVSVTVPNACVNSITESWAISVVGCGIQIFLVLWCASTELLFLTLMAHDRYVAICQPLHYSVIMDSLFCSRMTVVSVLCSLMYASVHTGNTFRLSFCQSNAVHQFFCDIPSLLRLSCSDTFSNELLILVSAIGIGGGCFTFIIVSYVHIFSTVLKFPASEQGKAFSTCVPHILVVSIFLSSGAYVYMRRSVTSDTILGMIFSIFYTVVPPFLNPIIYSMRNKQVKEAVRKVIIQKLYLGKV